MYAAEISEACCLNHVERRRRKAGREHSARAAKSGVKTMSKGVRAGKRCKRSGRSVNLQNRQWARNTRPKPDGAASEQSTSPRGMAEEQTETRTFKKESSNDGERDEEEQKERSRV